MFNMDGGLGIIGGQKAPDSIQDAPLIWTSAPTGANPKS